MRLMAGHLTMGPYWVDLVCPDCRLRFPVNATMATRLTITADQPAELRLVVTSTKVEHQCGVPAAVQLSLEGED